MELTGGGGFLWSVGSPVDHDAAGSADAFSAVGFKSDGFVALVVEVFVEKVQHF